MTQNDVKELNKFVTYLRHRRESEFENSEETIASLKAELRREREVSEGLNSLVEAKHKQVQKLMSIRHPAPVFTNHRFPDPSVPMIHTYQIRMQEMVFAIFGEQFDYAAIHPDVRHDLCTQFADGIRKEAYRAMEDAILRSLRR